MVAAVQILALSNKTIMQNLILTLRAAKSLGFIGFQLCLTVGALAIWLNVTCAASDQFGSPGTLVQLRSQSDTDAWNNFTNEFGQNLTPSYSGCGPLTNIIGIGLPASNYDATILSSVYSRANSVISALQELLRLNSQYPLVAPSVTSIALQTNSTANCVTYLENFGANVVKRDSVLGRISLTLDSQGALRGLTSSYFTNVVLVNEYNRYDFGPILLQMARELFYNKEGIVFTIKFHSKTNFVDFVDYEPDPTSGEALRWVAEQFSAESNGNNYETILTTDGCEYTILTPDRYRLATGLYKTFFFPSSDESNLITAIMAGPLPGNQQPMQSLIAPQILSLKGKTIVDSAIKLRFGNMTSMNPIAPYFKVGGADEIDMYFQWKIADFIEQTDLLGNEDSCDCTFGIRLRVTVDGSGLSLTVTLQPIRLSDIELIPPGNCKLLQDAELAGAVANFIQPITLTSTASLLQVNFKQPLSIAITKAVGEVTDLTNYAGNPVIERLVAYPAYAEIAYDLNTPAITPEPDAPLCWTTAGLPINTQFANVTGGKTGVAAIYPDFHSVVQVRPSSGRRFLPPEPWAQPVAREAPAFFC